ncbi:MAG: hypothetical protein HYZ77_03365 [Serratia liquefaciens]|nr:hypothetical protein [Serratia liquefaciens]
MDNGNLLKTNLHSPSSARLLGYLQPGKSQLSCHSNGGYNKVKDKYLDFDVYGAGH